MKKNLLIISVFLLGLFFSNLIFNHVNPWLGLLSYVLTFGATIYFFINKYLLKQFINEFKKNEDN